MTNVWIYQGHRLMGGIGVYAFPVIRNETGDGSCLVNWCEEKNSGSDCEQDKFHGDLLKSYDRILFSSKRSSSINSSSRFESQRMSPFEHDWKELSIDHFRHNVTLVGT